jgi:hypothetical protein
LKETLLVALLCARSKKKNSPSHFPTSHQREQQGDDVMPCSIRVRSNDLHQNVMPLHSSRTGQTAVDRDQLL